MKKIPTIFERDFDNNPRFVTSKRNKQAQWVFNGEGVATRKYDGTCCLVGNGKLWKRYEVRPNGTPPHDFVEVDFDEVTGKKQGWVEVGWGNEDKWHREAVGGDPDKVALADGTYELVGPKVQGNPEKYEAHTLVKHEDAEIYKDFPRDFEGIKKCLFDMEIEGIVWHHPDGRMAKIKKRDFDYQVK